MHRRTVPEARPRVVFDGLHERADLGRVRQARAHDDVGAREIARYDRRDVGGVGEQHELVDVCLRVGKTAAALAVEHALHDRNVVGQRQTAVDARLLGDELLQIADRHQRFPPLRRSRSIAFDRHVDRLRAAERVGDARIVAPEDTLGAEELEVVGLDADARYAPQADRAQQQAADEHRTEMCHGPASDGADNAAVRRHVVHDGRRRRIGQQQQRRRDEQQRHDDDRGDPTTE